MLEPQTQPMDNTRIKNILRKHPRLGRNLANAVALPTILSPKKSKKKSSGSQHDPQGDEDLIEGNMPVELESLFSEDNELQAEPLPASSAPLHDISTMKVLLTYNVWNFCPSYSLAMYLCYYPNNWYI